MALERNDSGAYDLRHSKPYADQTCVRCQVINAGALIYGKWCAECYNIVASEPDTDPGFDPWQSEPDSWNGGICSNH